MKAIVKVFLWVLVLALVCSAFFGFTGDESETSDKSFMENIKDGWDNVIDSIFPDKDSTDSDEGEDTDNSDQSGDNVAQTHNALHFAQSCASSLRYLMPRNDNQWQSINVLSGDPFLSYMLPDDYICFKNNSSQSVYIGTGWKTGVIVEIPANSESSNLDFSFHKDWYFWSASDYKPTDEELNANVSVISFTTEAGEQLTVYDEFDNIFSGKGKTSIELVLGREYTFTTTSKTLCIGAAVDSMVIAEFDSDDIFKFTPSASNYAIWVKEGSEDDETNTSPVAYVYCDSSIFENVISINDSLGNDLIRSSGETNNYDIDIFNDSASYLYCSLIGFYENGFLICEPLSYQKYTLQPDKSYYFWVGSESGEVTSSLAYLNVSSGASACSFSINRVDTGEDITYNGSVEAGTVVTFSSSDPVYYSTSGYYASDCITILYSSDKYYTLEQGDHYFWSGWDMDFDSLSVEEVTT